MNIVFRSYRQHRRRGPIRMLGIAMTVFVLLSVLTPLLQSAAADDIIGTDIVEETPQDDPNTDPEGDSAVVDEEETPPVDEPVVVDEETPGALVSQLEPIAFYINKHDCPSDFDGDYYRLAANCDEPAYEAQFEVFGPSLSWAITGDFEWSGSESGFHTFRELLPIGYAEPIVYCKLSDALGNSDGSYRAITYDGYYEVQIDPGLTLYCDWFNIPMEPVDGGTVIINKRFCDNGFDAYAADIYGLAANCQTQEAGVTFELWANGSIYDTQVTGGSGLVQFDDVPEGVLLSIVEPYIDGYGVPIVSCKLTYPTGGGNQAQQDVYNEGAYAIRAAVSVGETLYCDWFNIPEHDPYGGVEVIKYECSGVLKTESSLNDYQNECPQPHAAVEFKLDSASTGNPGNFPTDAYGVVRWDDLEADTYYLTETELEGYATPVVFCAIYDKSVDQTLEHLLYSVDAGRIEFDLAEGQYITCYWFNIPEHDHYGGVTVIKYECPEAIEHEASYEDYSYACTQPQADVDFKLDGASSGNPGNYLTDENGEVTWGDREADTYYLTETIPTGYGAPVVFCDTSYPMVEQIPVYDPYTVSDEGRIEFDLDEGQYIVCHWFNIPTDDASITIYKWLCPATFDLYDDAEATCAEPLNGVTFTADGPDGYSSQSDTGDAIPSAVRFGSLDAGHYEIEETLPSGIAYGFVASCRGNSNPVPAVYPLYHTEWGGAFNIELAEGDQVSCTWYNVPEYHEDDGTLTVVKYLCSGYVVSELTCDLYRDGQAFRLTAASGEGDPIDVETGADGTETLALPAGTWNLDEIGGDWCKAESYDLNEYGQIVTSEGHESVVSIYNCAPPTKTPPVKQPPTKQGPPITEFPNTGSGATAMAAGLSGSDLAGQGLILLLVAQGLVLIVLRRGGVLRFATRDHR